MDRPVQECLTPTAVCSEGNVQNAAARQRGDRWFKVIQEAQISLCRWAEFARTLGMRSDLNQDLQRLKSQHAIDDGLIESLVTSKAQANAHLQFWTRLMWTVNGSLILIFALISGFGLRQFLRGDSIWMVGLAGLALFVLFWMVSVLQRQRRAKCAVIEVARKYDLL